MLIRAGFELGFQCPVPTPVLLMLQLHPSRIPDLLSPEALRFTPPVSREDFIDGFGNTVSRVVLPAGRSTITNDILVHDSGLPDETPPPEAVQVPVERLPVDTLPFLLGSRYCETDRLSDTAWSLFGKVEGGAARVQAICDFVHNHIRFGYQHARPTRTAYEAYVEGMGVCRDFAHLAVAFCRCMNIPARYCTGYLGDIGVPPVDFPMDFSGWFDAWLDGRWYTFDARHNVPRIGRILMGRGRDATDVALTTSFGRAELVRFEVTTFEVAGPGALST